MCKQTFDVSGLDNERTAYEVEQTMAGMQNVDTVHADFITDSITVEYDETKIDEDHVLTAIEYAGCKPSDRIDGVLDLLRTRVFY